VSDEKAEVLLAERSGPAPLDDKSLAALCKNLVEAVFAIDSESGRIVYWNKGAETLFKYRADDILRQTAQKLFSDGSSYDAWYRVARPEIETNGHWRGEWEYRSRDGSPFSAEATGMLLRISRRAYITLVLRDISHRKDVESLVHRLNQRLARRVTERTSELISKSDALEKTENQRKQTEQLLEALLRNLNNYAILILSHEGYVLHANGGIERVLGYRSEEIEQRHLSNLYRAEQANEEKWRGILHQAKNQDSFRNDDWLLRKDGSHFYARVEVLALRDDAGALSGYVVLLRDDTEERKMKDRLKDKEHMAAIGTATAMLAHEIKNPLNGMSTTVQLLERSLRNNSQPSRETMMATVRDLKSEIGRLQSLLADFQAISHPQRLVFQSVDLTRLMRELMSLVRPESLKQQIKIVEEYVADLPHVEADSGKLKQAFINLIKNACEAMPQGGTLTTKAYLRNEGVCVEVIDTGEGIPEDLDIFELFSSTKAAGTGLGMVIVRQIILAHNGAIDYASQSGSGTTFRVTLPARSS
jgi:two-component system, sporulation sensor kinase E